MPQYKLTYFDGRGRAEIIRLIFAAAGEQYEDVRVDREKWTAMRTKSPSGQVPILEFDGKVFCQSVAIARYLARKFNLAGKTELDQLQGDMIIDCIEDATKPFLSNVWEQDEARKAVQSKKYTEETLPAAYANLEAILKSNKGGDGFFVGDNLTWVDLAFQMFVTWGKMGKNEAVLDKYPKLKALEKRVETQPKVAAWLAKRPETQF